MPYYDGEEYEYLTAQADDRGIRLYGWSEYPDYSVLAGQTCKRFLDHFPTESDMDAALIREGISADDWPLHSSPLIERSISLAHLPGEEDPVPGGMYPDDYD